MDNPMTGIAIVAVVFGIILTICWIVLPFAIFGIKRRLDKIIILMQKKPIA